MTTTAESRGDGAPSPTELQAEAASDLRDALGWLLFGAAVLTGSKRSTSIRTPCRVCCRACSAW
jgi:hypothetical protein